MLSTNRIKLILRDTLLAILLMGLVSFCVYKAIALAHGHCKAATFNYEDYRFCMGI